LPFSYKIFQDPLLVYIRYYGRVELPDVAKALSQFSSEVSNYHRQPHFLDFSRVTDYNVDYTEFFKLMGELAEAYPMSRGEHLFVFYAPEGPPADLAEILCKPFLDSPTLIVRTARTLEHAFDILGQQRPEIMTQMNADA